MHFLKNILHLFYKKFVKYCKLHTASLLFLKINQWDFFTNCVFLPPKTHIKKWFFFSGRTTKGVGRVDPPDH